MWRERMLSLLGSSWVSPGVATVQPGRAPSAVKRGYDSLYFMEFHAD